LGWFGGKSSHKKEVDSAVRVLANLFEKTTGPGSDAPVVLRFELPDSRYRYFVFCLSTVQTACAHRMKNPDAILNELIHTVVTGALNINSQQFFGGPIEPQRAANQAAEYIQDYLHRWSAYVDISGGGNAAAATGIIVGMLRSTESSQPPSETDAQRLWPLATWIEQRLKVMADAFTGMAR
jgi:hypothetical protein